ncbi:MAG: long-chain fatty acid--CoA ligase [Alphaproteobacteria bacterium]
MQITQGLRRAVQVNADGTATIFNGRRQTWRQFADRVARLAGAIAALGLKPGDRLAVLALNGDRYLEMLFAGWTAGAVLVPLNTRWAAPELAFALGDCGAAMLFVDDAYVELADGLRRTCPDVREVVYMGESTVPAGMHDYETVLDAAAPMADAGRGGDDIAGLYYTGGTTGRSKGVMLSHRNIVYNAINVAATIRFDRDTHWLHSAPMFHIADACGTLVTTTVGGCHSFLPSFRPEAAMQVIQDHKTSYSILIPTMINMLVNHPALDDYDLSHAMTCQFGGSPMPPAVLRLAMAKLPSWRFIHSFGMTELSPFTTALVLTPEMTKGEAPLLASCGYPSLGCEVRIVDEADREVPAGTVGQLLARGDNVMRGYWNRPEESQAALKDGWMHTGDAAYVDDDGMIYLVDRLKDMIISGGENVYPAEVEQAIYQHPAVLECAVIGMPDETWGEAVHAIVRCRDGQRATEAEIVAHCREHIAGYKCPRGVTFREEPMPLSGAGKIRKLELRELYARQPAP